MNNRDSKITLVVVLCSLCLPLPSYSTKIFLEYGNKLHQRLPVTMVFFPEQSDSLKWLDSSGQQAQKPIGIGIQDGIAILPIELIEVDPDTVIKFQVDFKVLRLNKKWGLYEFELEPEAIITYQNGKTEKVEYHIEEDHPDITISITPPPIRATFIVLDLNKTGKWKNLKNAPDYWEFIRKLWDKTQRPEVIVYKYMNLIPRNAHTFIRNNVKKIYTNFHESDKDFHAFKEITDKNVEAFWDQIDKKNQVVGSNQGTERFIVFEPLTKQDTTERIREPDNKETVEISSYLDLLEDLLSRIKTIDRKTEDVKIDEIIYISYYSAEAENWRSIKLYSFIDDEAQILGVIK